MLRLKSVNQMGEYWNIYIGNSIIHSHAAYDPSYKDGNNNFSPDADIVWAERENLDLYVTTPDGSLKKYDPKTNTVTTISTDMPKDPKNPTQNPE